jgi:hypothetical protein
MSDDQEVPLTAEDLRTVEGVAREAKQAPCPACGRALLAGQEVVTALGDVRRGAVGVTVHRRCFTAVGRAGLLDLMVAAYRSGLREG